MYRAKEFKDGIVFQNVLDFEPKHIFECGQCFRWNGNDDGSYTGVALKRAVRVLKNGNDLYIYGGKIEDEKLWISYFDLDRDYSKIKEYLSKDKILKEAINYGYGIRILRQDMFETTVSFIISANNMIPKIKKSVEGIAKKYGRELYLEGKTYYSFPDPKELLSACSMDYKDCSCGFRSPYLEDTIERLRKGDYDLNKIAALNTEDALKELIKFKGVGIKVADCIMLFSMGKYDAFPVDVWVKRIMNYFYDVDEENLKRIRSIGREKFGEYSGFAQQYLFYYAREVIKKDLT